MAYKSYPDSIPPLHQWEYDSGDYKAESNHHIADNYMMVDAYSLNQGIGKEISCILNFINSRNLALSNKKIASGYFYQIGSSGQADWYNTTTPLQYLWCKSGYIKEYYH